MTRTVLLGDVAEVLGGGTPSTKIAHYWEGDIPWITPRDLSTHHNVYISNGERHITESGLNNSSAKLLPKGAVIFSSRAPIGYVVIASQPMTTNQGCKGIICDESKIHNRFLYYWLKCNKQHIESRASGSTFKEISTSEMRNLAMDIPGIETQKKIADILGTIDEKIELNRKMNETLEQIGQALFRHYFITNPEVKKWEAGDISLLADNIKETAKPPFSRAMKYIALDHFTPKTLAIYGFTNADKATSNKTKFKKGDVLFGKLRPYFHKVSVAPFDGICSTDILVIRPKKEKYSGYVSFFMSQKSLIDYTTRSSEGTRMPRTSWTNICNYPTSIPPDDLLEKFNQSTEPLLETMINNASENQTLTTLRDTLLPRLISGKVDI